MKVISHAGHLHDGHHEHDESCGCGEEHSHVQVQFKQTLVGLLFVINSFIAEWVLDRGEAPATVSAMIGAVILGYPIIWTAIKDLRNGALTTNELVSLAVIASFASPSSCSWGRSSRPAPPKAPAPPSSPSSN
ncbi:MAG: hypothetical protein NTW03_07210 [Verrucomicrobia bacterium]|nr:hypothetical protein [Verrucomicrobiota bacterium]